MTVLDGATTYVDELARWFVETRFEDLPPDVVHHTELVLADTVGAVLGGSSEPEATQLAERVRARSLPTGSTILRRGFPGAEPTWAAVVNGTAGTFLELDEGCRPSGHPGIHVIPAALALGEQLHASGRDLVLAIALGYELPARIGAACKLRANVHSHGHWGSIGGAVACGKLLGFDARTMREAINSAAALPVATSWEQCFAGATVRNTYSGMSGFVGIFAANLAASGFTGLPDGIAESFGVVLGTDYDPTVLTRDLGRPYRVTQNYFKFHACCAACHPVLDAVMDATRGRTFGLEEVKRVEAKATSNHKRVAQRLAVNELSAKFSLPFAVGAALVRGSTSIDAFRPDAVADPAIRAMMDRVTIEEDAELTKQVPTHYPARVTIELTNGTRITGESSDTRGSFQNPVSEADLAAKFRQLSTEALTPSGSETAWERLTSAATVADVAELTGALRSGSR